MIITVNIPQGNIMVLEVNQVQDSEHVGQRRYIETLTVVGKTNTINLLMVRMWNRRESYNRKRRTTRKRTRTTTVVVVAVVVVVVVIVVAIAIAIIVAVAVRFKALVYST